MNGAAWAGRLGIIIAIIIIEKASPALAWFLVLASIIAWAGYLAYAGNYLPRWVVDMIERKQEPVPSAALLTVIDDKELAEKLKDQIVGQDEVIDQIATQVRRRVAARRPDKPIAVFCFAGPPGVGKTELAKVLNETLYKDRNHLHFYSFAEMGKSQASASTLFGAPKGYNGGEGTLTSALRRIPNAVVLLDEIEKAHPDTLKRFLSAWNDGAVTDQSTGARSPTSEAGPALGPCPARPSLNPARTRSTSRKLQTLGPRVETTSSPARSRSVSSLALSTVWLSKNSQLTITTGA